MYTFDESVPYSVAEYLVKQSDEESVAWYRLALFRGEMRRGDRVRVVTGRIVPMYGSDHLVTICDEKSEESRAFVTQEDPGSVAVSIVEEETRYFDGLVDACVWDAESPALGVSEAIEGSELVDDCVV